MNEMVPGRYHKLADIYDDLMAGIDYDEWVDYIEAILKGEACATRYVADLACGTGNTVLPLAARGYEVYGIDIAPDMLEKAQVKAKERGVQPHFLKQDMRMLELPREVDLVTCYNDGLNYITEPEDLKQVFRRVYASLRPGGMFIFDLYAVEKLSGIGGGTTFIDDHDLSLVWETSYEQALDIWEITLTGFIRRDHLYEKFIEVHQEKAYQPWQVTEYLQAAGLQFLAVYHAFSFEPPRGDTKRVFYVARKPAAAPVDAP